MGFLQSFQATVKLQSISSVHMTVANSVVLKWNSESLKEKETKSISHMFTSSCHYLRFIPFDASQGNFHWTHVWIRNHSIFEHSRTYGFTRGKQLGGRDYMALRIELIEPKLRLAYGYATFLSSSMIVPMASHAEKNLAGMALGIELIEPNWEDRLLSTTQLGLCYKACFKFVNSASLQYIYIIYVSFFLILLHKVNFVAKESCIWTIYMYKSLG